MKSMDLKVTAIIGIVLACITAVLIFILCNLVPTSGMKWVETDGRVFPVAGGEWNYVADTPVWRGCTTKGTLVMSNGTEYGITYSTEYDVFTIDGKFGMYVREEVSL